MDLQSIDVAILAGGLGTRLRPVVSELPKVLASVQGRPFLSYLLDQLNSAGFQRVTLCVGYKADAVQTAIGPTYGGLQIRYSVEEEPLGTGGALRLALPLFRGEYLLVMNGDTYVDVDFQRLTAFHEVRRAALSLALTWVSDSGRYGSVVTGEDGQIVRFDEKKSGAGPGWVNAGIQLLEAGHLAGIPERVPFSLEKQWLPELLAKKRAFGFCCDGRFIDIGTPESYRESAVFFGREPGSAAER